MREGLIDIDGSRGEGGGQILRTALALAMITGKPFVMRNIRAGRAKPGLRRQHVACVEAAVQLCGATVHGAKVSSSYLEFTPGPIVAASPTIDIGTAGSTTLVVQTILVPAIVAGKGLTATIIGGTHNPMAPPFEFLDRVVLPHLRAMGAHVDLVLDRHGFVTDGPTRDSVRGQLTLTVGSGALRPIELLEAGPITRRRATALIARLPTHVAERELQLVRKQPGLEIGQADCEIVEITDAGPGNALLLEIERATSRELVTGFGEKGVRAELVAYRACDELASFLAADVPVGAHLADQLPLPLAIAGGGAFRCAPLSLHATTNIDTIQQFLDVQIRVEPDRGAVIVRVG